MSIKPNLSKPVRVAYVLAGAVVAASPFFFTLPGWVRICAPICGIVLIVEGLAGW